MVHGKPRTDVPHGRVCIMVSPRVRQGNLQRNQVEETVTRPRQKPPTIRIGGQVRAMTGNAKDGYTLAIDDHFRADIGTSEVATFWHIKTHGMVLSGGVATGIHEQAAANAISRWFERRVRLWLGVTDARRAR